MESTDRINCPLCNASLKAKALPAPGAKVKCPKCSGEFRYSPTPSAPQPRAQKPNPPAHVPPPLPARVTVQTPALSKVQPKRSSSALWIVATLVGVVAAGGAIAVAAWQFNLLGPQVARNSTNKGDDSTAPVDTNAANPQDNGEATVNENGQPIANAAPKNEANQAGNAGFPEKVKLGDNEWPLILAYSADGALLAAANEYGINIWNRTSGKLVHIEQFSSRDDFQFRLSPNGAYAAIIARDPQNHNRFQGGVWSTSDGKLVYAYEWVEPPYGVIPGFAFSPKATYFASLAPNNAIVVTNLAKGAEVARLEGHTARIGALAFSSDEKHLFSGSGDTTDGTTRQWTIAQPQNSQILITGKAVGAIAALPDGKTLITAGFGETNQWRLSGDGSAALEHKIPESATSLQVAPDGASLYLVNPDQVAVWHTKSGEFSQPILQVSVTLPDELKASSLSHDGKSFCVLTRTGLAIWDVASRQRRAQFTQKGQEGFALVVGLSPDGTEFAAVDNGGALFRNATGGAIVAPSQVLALKSGVRGLRFGPREELLAIDLIPNAVQEHDPEFSLAARQGAEAYAIFERKLREQEHQFQEARSKAEKELIQRVQNENLGNVERILQERKAALLKFYEETKNLAREKFGQPKRQALAKLHAELREKHGTVVPWGEVAAIWKLGAPTAEITFVQPDFAAEEFISNPEDPASVAAPSILDPASPLGAGKWTRLPTALLHDARLLWFDRLKGATEVKLDSREQSTLNEPNLEINRWLLSPDGNQLLVKGTRKLTRENAKDNGAGQANSEKTEDIEQVRGILNLQTKKWVSLPVGRIDGAWLEACFTPDSKGLIANTIPSPIESESNKLSLRQFIVATGAETGSPIVYPGGEQLRELAVSPDGKWLAIIRGRQDTKLYLIDLATGKERPTTAPPNIALPTFSPDSKILAIAVIGRQESKHYVELIDVAKGQARATLKDWGSYIHAIAFSPDSRILVVGGGSLESRGYRDATSLLYEPGHATGEMRAYNADTGAAIAPLAGHSDVVTCLVFDRRGARLASGSLDRTVKIWDIAPALKAAEVAKGPAASKELLTPKNASEAATKTEAVKPIAEAPKVAAKNLSPASTIESNSLGMKFATVPAGEFLMGVPQNNIDTEPSERPQHKVRITKPLTIGIHEVTVGQFRAFVDATGHSTDAEKEGAGSNGYDEAAKIFVEDNYPKFNWRNVGLPQADDSPVTNISWNDAKAFCTWLSGKDGHRYRLPTEAEWEYCARAGSRTRYPLGDDESSLRGLGNIADAALRKLKPDATYAVKENDGYGFTAPVGKFKANAFGLYDMIGNVSEWCEDWHDPNYYAVSPEADPTGPASGETRVIRGGSWLAEPSGQRPAMRMFNWEPTWRRTIVGFRVVRE